MTRTPSLDRTASKAVVYLASRSRIRKRVPANAPGCGEVAGLLGDPRAGWVRRDACNREASGVELDHDADREVALTMLTGSWYARCLAGADEPADWPRRTAALIWRALGGTTP
jgi:hypothetical protein